MKSDDAPDFERYSSDYAGRTWVWYRGLIAECLRHSMPGPILDLGCGSGLLVECGVRYGLDIAGIDGSSAAIEQAMDRCPDLRVSVHDFRHPLPFESDSFAAVICHQVIEHLMPSTCVHLFRECWRILRPDGTLLMYCPTPYNRREARDPCHINLFTPSRLRTELCKAGFEMIYMSGDPRAVWPGGRFGRLLGAALHSQLGFERLAQSANAIVRKAEAASVSHEKE